MLGHSLEITHMITLEVKPEQSWSPWFCLLWCFPVNIFCHLWDRVFLCNPGGIPSALFSQMFAGIMDMYQHVKLFSKNI